MKNKNKLRETKTENLWKMFLATAKDTQTVVNKINDRLRAMKNLGGVAAEKQKEIAQETLEIYAPLANRLGMGETKGQLEDLAFPLVYPQEYGETKKILENKYEQKEKDLAKIKNRLTEELKNSGLRNFQTDSRVKHLYSLFKKLRRPEINKDIDRVYDLIALRIIIPTIEDCYRTLGIIHKLWEPLPERIKDFIVTPKPNGYQSLHTTISAEKGKFVEIQIRTQEMHEHAEKGVAAHWVYDELGKPKKIPKSDKHLSWTKDLQNKVFCFTPAGDVIDLPQGATALDFAYAVHTEIGDRAVGALINNRFVSLDSQLKNGDVIEIKTQKNKKLKKFI